MNKQSIFTIILIISQFLPFEITANGNMSKLEMGTAIYRNLNTGGVVGNHWHTGIFNYFSYSTYYQRGEIYYTENGGSTIKKEFVSCNLLSASNYPSALSYIKNQFRYKFEKNGQFAYTGAYSRATSPSTRASISSTAKAMALDNIGYCWVNMLESYGNWEGTIADIKKTRCDGVVEYSYEKNGVIVSKVPSTPYYDDISQPNNTTRNLHNDFHNFWYNPGELCPRIQSGEGHGGGGSVSYFSPLQSANPITSGFTSTQYSNKIQLNFRVRDDASVRAFVLIKIKKSSESNWHVLVDENSNEWKFKSVSLTDYNGSEQYDFFHIPWNGRYIGGKYISGNHNFDIKITVIDQGANYTDTYHSFSGNIKQIKVGIMGPHDLEFKEQGTWTANVFYGSGSQNYAWYQSYNGGSTWTGPISSSNSFTRKMLFSDFILRCDVTDTQTNETDSDTHEVIYNDGELPLPKIESENEIVELPKETALGVNYPNPFNPTTTIKYQLKEDGFVSLKVFDVLGKEVAHLVNQNQSAGFYNSNFDASYLASGLYIYRLHVNGFVESKKMMLTK